MCSDIQENNDGDGITVIPHFLVNELRWCEKCWTTMAFGEGGRGQETTLHVEVPSAVSCKALCPCVGP